MAVKSLPHLPAPVPRSSSVANTLDQWLRLKSRSGKWASVTAEKIEGMARTWLHFLGGKLLAEVQPLDIQAIYLHLLEAGNGPWWINDHRARLRTFWLYCLRTRLVVNEIFSEDSWPQLRATAEHEEFELSEEMEERLIGVLPTQWRRPVGAYVRLVLRTALRRRAIYGLTCAMVSPDWWLDVPDVLVKTHDRLRFPLGVFPLVVAALSPLGAPADPLIPGLPAKSFLNRLLRGAAGTAGVKAEVFTTTELRRIALDRYLRATGGDFDGAKRYFGWKRETTMTTHYRFMLSDRRREDLARNLIPREHPPKS